MNTQYREKIKNKKQEVNYSELYLVYKTIRP